LIAPFSDRRSRFITTTPRALDLLPQRADRDRRSRPRADVHSRDTVAERRPFDSAGFVLMTTTLVAIMFGLDLLAPASRSPRAWACSRWLHLAALTCGTCGVRLRRS